MDKDELGYKVSNVSLWVLVATLIVVPMVLAWPQIAERSWFANEHTEGSERVRWVGTDGHEYVYVGSGDCVEEEQDARRKASSFEEKYGGIYLVIAQYDGRDGECVTGRRTRDDEATIYKVEDPYYVVDWINR